MLMNSRGQFLNVSNHLYVDWYSVFISSFPSFECGLSHTMLSIDKLKSMQIIFIPIDLLKWLQDHRIDLEKDGCAQKMKNSSHSF